MLLNRVIAKLFSTLLLMLLRLLFWPGCVSGPKHEMNIIFIVIAKVV
jgi:hypothetical protein